MKKLSILVAVLVLAPSAGAEPVRNGFDLAGASVPEEQILAGGPPRDGIPALDHPTHMAAATSAWPDEEIVLGVARDGEARAYPVAILNWHELVNDTLGGDPILVSYCPLCGTGLAFDRRVGGKTRSFGVSGLLFRSDLLMFDRESESLWSQISAEALSGPQRGERLRLVRARMMEWSAWKRAHPDTTILSPATSHRRDYRRSPYEGYATSTETYFPVKLDPRYHPKMPTLGLRIAGRSARGYPASELVQAGGTVKERFLGHTVRVSYDGDRQVFDVEAPTEVEVIEGYWFAWAAFHPSATLFTARAED